MVLDSFTNGTAANATEVNNNFLGNVIQEIYTGTGFNSVLNGAGSNTASHELNVITAAVIGNSDYVIIEVTCSTIGEDSNDIDLKIESKDVGGSYVTDFDNKVYENLNSDRITVIRTIKWVHTLTANEKLNGLQLQLTSTCTNSSTGSSAFTNVQTIITTGI